ncbi:MAG: hypothetical protein HGGPFJEG_01593 [Ignavibacteria bacterium]|nr:hypothetical protein [Ignavibacteria bacterium]
MENFRIHIICQKPEICSLIKKSLTRLGLNVSCSESEGIFEQQYMNNDIKIDCMILDKKLSDSVADRMNAKNKDISFIYLPSLDIEKNEINTDDGKISEPLKISELSNVIQNILSHKRV